MQYLTPKTATLRWFLSPNVSCNLDVGSWHETDVQLTLFLGLPPTFKNHCISRSRCAGAADCPPYAFRKFDQSSSQRAEEGLTRFP